MLVWALDCRDCGAEGTVELTQDVETGDLVTEDGARAHELVCECGSDDLVPAIVGELAAA